MMMMPSQAFNYYVGGKDGWSLNPSKSFNDWASQNRFQVHDSLENCNKGQKIIVLVMAPRHASPAPAPSPAPLQGSHSPETSTPPGISPAASVPSEAAAPFPQGPSRAPPPDDGKSASAPALGGDLVTAVLLFWIAYVNCNIVM
uniref:Phytocyanin domain-containing protein n=1 Tax=Daucus carota subsp. sativus TaxID=79200 RepID=A0A164ZHK6_DAUCS